MLAGLRDPDIRNGWLELVNPFTVPLHSRRVPYNVRDHAASGGECACDVRHRSTWHWSLSVLLPIKPYC